MSLNWCVECYSESRQTVAAKSLDGEPLCDKHYLAAIANGEKDMDEKICGREGCGVKLTAACKSGYCGKHFHDSKRKTPLTNGHKPTAPKRPAAQRVTVSISVATLDGLWDRLSPEEKAQRLFVGDDQ